jgi:hypothetical protein
MDEKAFKKHLTDLAHGRHHPDEHDWSDDSKTHIAGVAVSTSAKAKTAAPNTKKRAKRS